MGNECSRNCSDHGSTLFWNIQFWNEHVQVYLEEGNKRVPQQRVLPSHCFDAPLQQADEARRMEHGHRSDLPTKEAPASGLRLASDGYCKMRRHYPLTQACTSTSPSILSLADQRAATSPSTSPIRRTSGGGSGRTMRPRVVRSSSSRAREIVSRR